MAQVTPSMINAIQKEYEKKAALVKPKTAAELANAQVAGATGPLAPTSTAALAKQMGMTEEQYIAAQQGSVDTEYQQRLQALNALAAKNTGALADVYNAKAYATPEQLATAGNIAKEFGYDGSLTPSTYQGTNQAIIEGNLLANPMGNPENMSREQALAYNKNIGTGSSANSTGVIGQGTTQKYAAPPPSYDAKTMVFNTANNIPTPATSVTSSQDYQSKLLEAQKAATLAGLDTARQTSLSALNAQESALTPQFAQQRSNARAQSQRGAKSFAEFLATRGLTSSGGAALGETQRLGALQGTIGGLQQQEQAQLGEINRLRTLAEQNYATGLQGADAAMNAQNYQNLIDAQRMAEERAYNESLLAKTNASNQEINDRNAWINTIGQFSNNYQAEIDRINNNIANGDQSESWKLPYLGAARQDKINQLGLDQQGNAIPVSPTNTIPQITSSSAALQLWEQLGTANEAIAQALGIPVGTKYTQAAQIGSGGTGGTTKETYTPDQYKAYVNFRDKLNAYYTDNQQGLIDNLLIGKESYIRAIGEPLYKELLNNAYNQVPTSTSTTTVTPKMNKAILNIQENYDPSTTWYKSAVLSYLDGLYKAGDISASEADYIAASFGIE